MFASYKKELVDKFSKGDQRNKTEKRGLFDRRQVRRKG